MATFQMEMRQQQQQQRTNLKQRATASASKARQQRQQREQQQHSNPPEISTDCTRLWPSSCNSKIGPLTSHSSPIGISSKGNISGTGSNIRVPADRSSCQRGLIMLSMLVVVAALISGNGVLAAQRDSYKSKDMSSSNNAIPSGAGSSAGENEVTGPAGGAGSGSSNNSSGINRNGQAAVSESSSSMTTDASRSTAGSSTTIMGIPSSSLHKASSQASSNSFTSQLATGISRNSIELEEARNAGPYFDKAYSKNVTALLGKTAYLNCRVKNLGNKTMLLQVSWVRHRDIHLLTVGRYTYTSDQRFRAIHQPQTEDWMLQIKYPQHRDSGIYECQVSTTPHMSHYIHLNVVEPSTEIIGAPDLYIESGSTINLTCVILNSPEPPAYIFWNHNNAIINYDSPRGGVSVVTNKGDTTTSFLLIKSARPSDSGHYQCNPSNAKPKSVTVHVLNGVSHSVSRGVPSSNAARGTSASSPLAHSLSLCVPVCVLLQLGACRWLAALLGAALGASHPSPPHRSTPPGGRETPGGAGSRAPGHAPLIGDMRHFLECVLRWQWRWCWRWHWKSTQEHRLVQHQPHLPHQLKLQSRQEAATCRQLFEADIR
ncbi:uncharacterized protein Dana_GF17168, isoform F [Drosophila ananassae]|uniref:Uncharacterized protein, isoform F n=1 Tax=Drosophila ananassae TaxID=7217 RepID=A0A0P8XY52_DROAN|nr:uncharacterized protein LOC6499955 isoform X2 [Drosophila ananassae]KPU79574.1 uncharacterized protein Dana_GF17168, isoform F [Drosophila ananassae]